LHSVDLVSRLTQGPVRDSESILFDQARNQGELHLRNENEGVTRRCDCDIRQPFCPDELSRAQIVPAGRGTTCL
jgi:hypothetical protein